MSATEDQPAGLTREVTICNQKGLHARASARFVKRAADFDADLTVSRDGMSVAGTSIMGLMMLAAAKGSSITISARGPEASQALEAIVDLIEAKFDEDQASGQPGD